MAFVRFLVWTALAMGLGAWAATVQVGDRTPLQHLERLVKTEVAPPKLDKLREKVGDTLEDAKDSVGAQLERRPRERHSVEDKTALEKLIAKGSPGK
jgi:hypothetical protein